MISIEEEYKKTGIKPSDIAELRQWLTTQPHLPGQYITDLDLLLAYHCCSKSSSVTKQLLDLNFTLRTLFTNIFQNRVVDESIIKSLDYLITFHLDTPSTEEKYRVIYYSVVDPDLKKFSYNDITRAMMMLIDLIQYRDGTAPGYIMLVDMNRVTLGHLSKIDLQTLQQTLYFLQEAIFLRLKGIHFLNAPSIVDKLLLMMKPFLKKELFSKICIHTASSIDDFISIEALPKEAGGKTKSYAEATKEAVDLLVSNKEFFETESKKRVVESLRPGKPKTITDIFGGIEGSFKKLDLD